MTLADVQSFGNQVIAFLSRPDIGSGASVIASLLSFRVWLSLRDLKRKVLFRQRAPDQIIKIRLHASNLDKMLGNYEDERDNIHTESALALETLKAVLGRLNGPAKAATKKAIGFLEKYRKLDSSIRKRTDARDVYTNLLSSALAIENMLEDAKQEV